MLFRNALQEVLSAMSGGLGRVPQSVKVVSQAQGPKSDPRTKQKGQLQWCELVNIKLGGGDSQNLGMGRPARLPYLATSRPVRDSF